jgi:hypothetical protein
MKQIRHKISWTFSHFLKFGANSQAPFNKVGRTGMRTVGSFVENWEAGGKVTCDVKSTEKF